MLDRTPITLAWDPTPEVVRIRKHIESALDQIGPIKEGDVIAAMIFLIIGTINQDSVDLQTAVMTMPFLQVAMRVFKEAGCKQLPPIQITSTKKH